MATLTVQQKSINEILSRHGFEFIDAFEIEQWHKDGDDLQDEIQSRINEQEIIYYSKAIEYLHDNDASLMEACELAHDYGYTTDKLNSELLATLLYQSKLSNDVGDLVKELENYDFEEDDVEEED